MLILMRRVGEAIYVGDEVRLTVLGVRGNQVRIGVHAPKHIPVHREEVYHRIKGEGPGPGSSGTGEPRRRYEPGNYNGGGHKPHHDLPDDWGNRDHQES